MTKLQTIQETKEFEVFTTISLPISLNINAATYEEAIEKASLKLDQDTILQALLTLITLNGEVVTPTVHHIETDDYEVIEK